MVARRRRIRHREPMPYDDAPSLPTLRPSTEDDEFDLALIRAQMPRRGRPEPESFLRLFVSSDDTPPLPIEDPPHDPAGHRPGDLSR